MHSQNPIPYFQTDGSSMQYTYLNVFQKPYSHFSHKAAALVNRKGFEAHCSHTEKYKPSSGFSRKESLILLQKHFSYVSVTILASF